MSNIIKFFDLQINLDAINKALIARETGFSRQHIGYLLSYERNNEEAQKKVYDALVSIYGTDGDAVKHIPLTVKIKNKESKKLLKKSA